MTEATARKPCCASVCAPAFCRAATAVRKNPARVVIMKLVIRSTTSNSTRVYPSTPLRRSHVRENALSNITFCYSLVVPRHRDGKCRHTRGRGVLLYCPTRCVRGPFFGHRRGGVRP